METIKNLLKKHWIMLLGIFFGALGGFLYWYFIGCSSGTCPITSSPTTSILFGAVMGGLLGDTFKKEKEKRNSNQ